MTAEPFGLPPGNPTHLVVPAKEETPEEYAERLERRAKLEHQAFVKARREKRRAAVRKAAPEVASVMLELAGVAIVAYGVWTMWPWLGVVIAGLGVIIVGMAISPPAPRRRVRVQSAPPVPPEVAR